MVDVAKLFEEPTLKQITTWARGVYENKDARDVVVAIAEAAKKEGKYTMAFENYVDLPDRIYVPVRAYARIAEEPIESVYLYENEAPNITVLTEETLCKGCDVAEGAQPGAVLVVNTKRTPQEISKFVKNLKAFDKLVTIDANALAMNVVTLAGAEGTTDVSGIGKGMGAALAGAVCKATGIVKLESLKGIIANLAALESGYNNAVVADVASLSVSA